jgi:hypothetical protein
MPNGAAVRLAPEPPTERLLKGAPAGATASKPGTARAATGIEVTIGEAMADAAAAIGQALVDFAAGGRMTPATRALSGECLGRVCELQLDTVGELDFGAVAHVEGRRILLARHGAVLRKHCGTVPEAALDELLGYVIGIANKVVRDELRRPHHRREI